MPVVYTPTVGEAIQRFSDEYRGQRGLFLSIDEPDEIAEAFETFGLGPDDVDLIVCTDAEAILGIGDWGVGGIQIAVGKLALYTAGGGIDPCRCIAVSLDVGTDNEQLLQDPFYLGNRHARRRGERIRRVHQAVHRDRPPAISAGDPAFRGLRAAQRAKDPADVRRRLLRLQRRRAGNRRGGGGRRLRRMRMSPVSRCATRKRSSSEPGPPASVSPIRSGTRWSPTAPPSSRPRRRSGRSTSRACCSTTWTTCAISRCRTRRTARAARA